jgi:hypothetical protein
LTPRVNIEKMGILSLTIQKSERTVFPLNLIECEKSCIHQQDGFCHLQQSMMHINPYPVDGCCYYQKRNPDNPPTISKPPAAGSARTH